MFLKDANMRYETQSVVGKSDSEKVSASSPTHLTTHHWSVMMECNIQNSPRFTSELSQFQMR